VFVSCGATDPENLTGKVLAALDGIEPNISTDVILSSRASHLQSIRDTLPAWGTLHIDAQNIAELMTAADIAIGTAGATSYERAVLGLPSIAVMIAENQRGIYQTFLDAGACLGAGVSDMALPSRLSACIRALLADSDLRARMSTISANLVDGRGTWRVMLALAKSGVVADGSSVRLRLAEASDEGRLLNLQSQPSTRLFFRNSSIPDRQEHRLWMVRTLNDPAKLLFIIDVDGHSAGSLRLDAASTKEGLNTFEVSIAVDQGCARRGIATEAVRFAQRLLPGARLHAEVASQNTASQRLFMRAGFTQTSPETFDFAPHEVCASILAPS
jgi:RimJ/RimL family protein N-acetyltransferase